MQFPYSKQWICRVRDLSSDRSKISQSSRAVEGGGSGRANFWGGGENLSCCRIFCQTCMKMKDIEGRGGRIPSTPPFGQPIQLNLWCHWLTKWSWGGTCMWSVGPYLSIVLTQEGLVRSTLMTPMSAHKYFVEVYGTHTHTHMYEIIRVFPILVLKLGEFV